MKILAAPVNYFRCRRLGSEVKLYSVFKKKSQNALREAFSKLEDY